MLAGKQASIPDILLLLRDEVERALATPKGGDTHCYLNSLETKESVKFRKLKIWEDLQRFFSKSTVIVAVSVDAGAGLRTIGLVACLYLTYRTKGSDEILF